MRLNYRQCTRRALGITTPGSPLLGARGGQLPDQETRASRRPCLTAGDTYTQPPRVPKLLSCRVALRPGPHFLQVHGSNVQRGGFRSCACGNSAQAHNSLPWAPGGWGKACSARLAQVHATCCQSPSPRDVPECWFLASWPHLNNSFHWFCFLTQGLGSPGQPRATHLPNLATTAQVPLCPAWLYFLMSCLYGIVFIRAALFFPLKHLMPLFCEDITNTFCFYVFPATLKLHL